jgi:hypothetical protein
VQAIEAAQVLVDELQLHGLTTPEQFLADREEALDAMFPTAQLLPGAGGQRRRPWSGAAAARRRLCGLQWGCAARRRAVVLMGMPAAA